MKHIRILLFALIAICTIISCKKETNSQTLDSTPKAPQFIHEGDLVLLRETDTLKSLKIELAITDAERNQGLMYRTSMKENQAMLFLFEDEQPRGFYMKNTKIPLDLMYIDATKKIVSIHKNAIPLDQSTIPSIKPAMYVLEVNGGMCDKWGIKEGDQIEYSKL